MDRTNCMARCGLRSALLAVVLLGGATSGALGQELRREAGEYDFYFYVPYVDGLSEEFQGSTVVNTDSDYGFGFGLDYSYNGRWSIGGTIGYVEQDYDVDLAFANGARDLSRGELEATSFAFNMTRHFRENRALSPYLGGTIGFVYIDSRIPEGPPVGGPCWWDPWWGYTCGVFQDTKTFDEFNYGFGGGLRWDVTDRVFLDLNVSEQWINFENAVGGSHYTTSRIAVGFRQ